MRLLYIVLLLAMSTACEQKPAWQGSLDTLLASQPGTPQIECGTGPCY